MMTILKKVVPVTLKNRIKTSPLFVRYRTRYTNIYHCSVYRTGSQWLKRLLSDLRVCQFSGLLYDFQYHRVFGTSACPDQTITKEFPFTKPFTPNKIVSVYASYESYLRIPKPDDYRTFYIGRDPREITISHYFASLRDATRHPQREFYKRIANPNTGIPWMIDTLDQMALFTAMRSWADAANNDAHVLVLRFEDLIGPDQFHCFQRLLAHCDIAMPDDKLKKLLDDHSFEKMTGGRKPGQEDASSHYRKGVANDWKNHLTGPRLKYFQSVTGDLAAQLGYE